MRTRGTALELERRRELAVARVSEGHLQKDVAAILGIHPDTLSRWVRMEREGGMAALKAKPTPGRPRKLSARQDRAVLSWLSKSPKRFGFPDELWTSRRVASLIEQRLGVHFNANYLVEWLTQHGLSSQKPMKKALERNETAIAQWVAQEWPCLGKKPKRRERTSC
jgi:transposase